MAKKWTIVLCFFSMLTFLTSLISTITVILNENARTELNSTEVLATNNTYKSTSITYDQPNELNLVNLMPGHTITNTFSITNEHSNTIKYSIKWYSVDSNWDDVDPITNTSKPEEFKYTLVCSDGEKVENKTMPTNEEDMTIIKNLELKTNKTAEHAASSPAKAMFFAFTCMSTNRLPYIRTRYLHTKDHNKDFPFHKTDGRSHSRWSDNVVHGTVTDSRNLLTPYYWAP